MQASYPAIIQSPKRQAASIKRCSSHGATMIELLVGLVITSISSAAIFAMLLANNYASMKISNKVDAINSAKTVIERIGRDVRMARSIGDVFGTTQTIGDPLTGQSTTITMGSDTFPSSSNPIYGNGQSPPEGWPASWTAPPWTLSNTCLIVQVPIFDATASNPGVGGPYGFPTMIAQGSGDPPAAVNQDNVETHVYRIVADPDVVNHPGEYVMQLCSFPGMAATGYVPAAHNIGPQTIVKGITGPLDAGGQPKIFQYVDKTDSTGTAQDTITDDPNLAGTGEAVANYTGVLVNIEITNKEASRKQPVTLGFKTEVFMRNNALATTTGQPNQVDGGGID